MHTKVNETAPMLLNWLNEQQRKNNAHTNNRMRRTMDRRTENKDNGIIWIISLLLLFHRRATIYTMMRAKRIFMLKINLRVSHCPPAMTPVLFSVSSPFRIVVNSFYPSPTITHQTVFKLEPYSIICIFIIWCLSLNYENRAHKKAVDKNAKAIVDRENMRLPSTVYNIVQVCSLCTQITGADFSSTLHMWRNTQTNCQHIVCSFCLDCWWNSLEKKSTRK